MKKASGLLALSVLAITFSGCKQPDTYDADVKAIKDTEAQWVKDYAAKDPAKLDAHYTDDAVVMMSGQAPMTDKDTILASIKKMTDDPMLSVTFHADDVDVAKSGDLGYSRGKYSVAMTDPITKAIKQDHGSYVTIYRKQPDGSWKATEDIISTEVAPVYNSAASATKPTGKAFHVSPFD